MEEHLRSLVLSETEVRTLVADLHQDWTIQTVSGLPGSSNSLYALDVKTQNGPRQVICKCAQETDAEEFRFEPYLLKILQQRTSIPVPEVLSIVDYCETVGGPLFLMERCSGENIASRARSIDAVLCEQIAYEAGQYLGQLHNLGSFDQFGSLRLARDTDQEGGGLEADDCTLTVADGSHDDWCDWFHSLASLFCSNLDDRFADFEGPLREKFDEEIELLGGEEPVLTHKEYTFWNILVDLEIGETTAVLDFEGGRVGCAEYDIAAAIDSLSALAPANSTRRQLVRESLYSGYEEKNALPKDRNFDQRRDLYALAVRLPFLIYFDSGLAIGPDDPETLMREHREFVTELL